MWQPPGTIHAQFLPRHIDLPPPPNMLSPGRQNPVPNEICTFPSSFLHSPNNLTYLPQNKQEPMSVINHSLYKAHGSLVSQGLQVWWGSVSQIEMAAGHAGRPCSNDMMLETVSESKTAISTKNMYFQGSLEEAERPTPPQWWWTMRWPRQTPRQTPWIFVIDPLILFWMALLCLKL